MINVGIIGSTGYVGNELVRLLLQHNEVTLKHLVSRSYVSQPFHEVYENFNGFCDIDCEAMDMETMAKEVDVIFLALPHGLASQQVTSKVLTHAKVIDLGADFRLKSKQIYETWYKTDHHNEALLSTAEYGLCEWNRNKIAQTSLIANPGCYTTCSLLSLFPLVKEGIIDPSSIIVDAKSGVTGAGRSINLGTHYTECNESLKAYKVASHRHTPEIEQELSAVNGGPITINFTPHLIPMNRGILTTSYATLTHTVTYEEVKKIYDQYYAEEYFIRVVKEGKMPETRWVKGSNFCDIGFTIDPRTNRIIVVGVIDNLIKGAAGQALQNMNIMFGIDEKEGINQIPAFPI